MDAEDAARGDDRGGVGQVDLRGRRPGGAVRPGVAACAVGAALAEPHVLARQVAVGGAQRNAFGGDGLGEGVLVDGELALVDDDADVPVCGDGVVDELGRRDGLQLGKPGEDRLGVGPPAGDDVGQLPEEGYFLVMDQRRRIIGRAGDTSEMEMDLISMENVLQTGLVRKSRKIEFSEKKLLDMLAPIHLKSGFDGLVRLGLSRENEDQVLVKNRRDIFISMAFMVVLAVLSMWLLYKNQNRHLAKMGEMERRIQQAERLSAMGRLAAGVAHEIRNPLNAISMASQRLQRDNLHQLTGVIRDEIRRLNQIIEEFLSLSRSRKLQFKRLNLTDLLHQIILLMGEEADSKGVTIQMARYDTPFIVSMDSDKLKQALLNIIKNGIESISGDGAIDISLSQVGSEQICVRISDTGAGLTQEEIRHIFDLDYTTKEKGLGLGLPLAHEIIRGHGGEIQVHSRPGEGTTFEITLMLQKSKMP